METHISVLNKHNLIGAFKCDKCSKVFSTEDYLNAHIRRRHSEEDSQMNDSETDKLQSEIKQLKERLNSAEKMLQEKAVVESENPQKNGNDDIVAEIQEKFNSFKEQVENEIANLQLEKTFYEEKYGKMFDLVVQSKNNRFENNGDKSFMKNANEKIENSTQTLSISIENITVENCTQTEQTKKNMQMETVQNVSIPDQDNISDTQEYINDRIEEKINDFGETIDSKVIQVISMEVLNQNNSSRKLKSYFE